MVSFTGVLQVPARPAGGEPAPEGGLPFPGEAHLIISRPGRDPNGPWIAPAGKPGGNVACAIRQDFL
jgi:hypothetical protein